LERFKKIQINAQHKHKRRRVTKTQK